MIETALINILKSDAGLTALIGGRVRPFTDASTAPFPALTYWRSNSERPISNDGPTGQAIAQFQLDAWADDAATCWAVMDAARLATNGISGVYSGVYIGLVRWTDQSDQVNTPALPGRQKAVQRVTAILSISYDESTVVHTPVSGFSSAFG